MSCGNLIYSDFSGCDLSNTNLSQVKLNNAILYSSNLMNKFCIDTDGNWYNKRLEEERRLRALE
jgi:uncharacterized protein YjbI with pentapeptide repeats